MKRAILCAVLATMFAACAKDFTKDIATTAPSSFPEKIYATMGDSASRVELNGVGKCVWTEDDSFILVNTAGEAGYYAFQGKTGETTGEFRFMFTNGSGVPHSKPYAMYGTSVASIASADGTAAVSTQLKSLQDYNVGSYDSVVANAMIAVDNDGSNNLTFESIYGYLKVSLTGTQQVTSIKLTSEAQYLSGYTSVPVADITQFGWHKRYQEGSFSNRVELHYVHGVQLSSTPTDFYIIMAPQTYEAGVVMTITFSDGTQYIKENTSGFTIRRNTIQPLTTMNVVGEVVDRSGSVKVVYTKPEAYFPLFSGNENAISGTVNNGDGTTSSINEHQHYIFVDSAAEHTVEIQHNNAVQIDVASFHGVKYLDLSNF